MKSNKERGEKNAMQVTLVPASTGFDTQSFFLKQPVAAAPIHCDPLTLRVPVRGAKSGRLLLLMLTVMSLTGKPSFAAEPLGRFFFTPAQRAQLDLARIQKSRVTLASDKEQEAAPVAEILTLGGSVRRSDGKSTVWINNRAINDRDASGGVIVNRLQPNGALSLQVPQSARSIELKVGQSVDIVSGTIEEPYARQITAPKPAGPESAAGKPAPGTPPAPGEKAAATAGTPEQKVLEAKPESALERLKRTPPEASNAPDRR